MFPIDDFSVVIIMQSIGCKLLFNLLFYFFNQAIFDFFIAVNIIRCNTGLCAVEIFSKYDSSGSQLEVGAFLYDTRTFSSKFKSDRRTS